MSADKITYQPKVNYYLIAIASVLKDYRISFFINQALHLDLEKSEDFISDNRKTESSQKHGRYYFLDDKSEFEYYLIQNKALGNVYLKSLKSFDFLFVVKTVDEDIIDIGSLCEKVKRIKDVQLAIEISKIKPRELKQIEKDF